MGDEENPVIVFEFLGLRFVPLLLWYLWRKWRIAYVDASPVLLRLSVVQAASQHGTVRKISWEDFSLLEQYGSNSRALKDIDSIFSLWNAGTGIGSLMEELVESPEIRLSYKKTILESAEPVLSDGRDPQGTRG